MGKKKIRKHKKTTKTTSNIFEAIDQRNLSQVKAFVEDKKFNIEQKNETTGSTPLIHSLESLRRCIMTHNKLKKIGTFPTGIIEVLHADQKKFPITHAPVYLKIVLSLLNSGANTRQKSPTGLSPLQISALIGATTLCETLLKINPDTINNIGPAGTAFSIAVRENHIDTAKKLLEHKANPNLISSREHPFIQLAINEQYEFMTLLMEKYKIKLNKASREVIFSLITKNKNTLALYFLNSGLDFTSLTDHNGQTMLHHAAGTGNTRMTQAIAERKEYGALLKKKDNAGCPPLFYATERNCTGSAKTLGEAGACQDLTPKELALLLHLAICNNNSDLALFFLVKNAPTNYPINETRNAALHYAGKYLTDEEALRATLYHANQDEKKPHPLLISNQAGHLPIHVSICHKNLVASNLFLEKKPETLNKPNKNGDTPLLLSMNATQPSDTVLIAILIEKGANLKYRNPTTGVSAIHMAAALSSLALKIIFEAHQAQGLDTEYCDLDEKTPLHHAIFQGSLESVNYLIEQKANLKATDKRGLNPLIYTILAKKERTKKLKLLIKYYLKNGFSLDEADKRGYTPIMHAAARGFPDCVQLLLEAGANPYLKSTKAETADSLAISESHKDVLTALYQYKKKYSFNRALEYARTGDIKKLSRAIQLDPTIINRQRNGDNKTLLLAAVEGKQLPIVIWLIEEKIANPYLKNTRERDALTLSIEKKFLEIARYILSLEREGKIKFLPKIYPSELSPVELAIKKGILKELFPNYPVFSTEPPSSKRQATKAKPELSKRKTSKGNDDKAEPKSSEPNFINDKQASAPEKKAAKTTLPVIKQSPPMAPKSKRSTSKSRKTAEDKPSRKLKPTETKKVTLPGPKPKAIDLKPCIPGAVKTMMRVFEEQKHSVLIAGDIARKMCFNTETVRPPFNLIVNIAVDTVNRILGSSIRKKSDKFCTYSHPETGAFFNISCFPGQTFNDEFLAKNTLHNVFTYRSIYLKKKGHLLDPTDKAVTTNKRKFIEFISPEQTLSNTPKALLIILEHLMLEQDTWEIENSLHKAIKEQGAQIIQHELKKTPPNYAFTSLYRRIASWTYNEKFKSILTRLNLTSAFSSEVKGDNKQRHETPRALTMPLQHSVFNPYANGTLSKNYGITSPTASTRSLR